MGDLDIREPGSLEESRGIADLFDEVWGEARVMTPALVWALASHGGQVLGAWRQDALVGGQVGLVGIVDGRPILHSHITGVRADAQHLGIGLRLKRAQRDWCLARGIDLVTWTFDPMIARNAYFNLRKLGVVADRFLRDHYGDMDDAFNAGERSDRLEARWELRSPRVRSALEGTGGEEPGESVAVLGTDGERPVPAPGAEAPRLLLRVPSDYLTLRARHRSLAGAWRDAVADAFEDAFGRGYRAVGFLRDGAYVLERRPA